MKIIDRYLLKSHIGPFIFAFITILFVLILQFFAVFSERLLGKGIGWMTLLELVVVQSAWMVSFTIPMAVLIAVVMAFGAMTNASEITIFRASGISLYRLMAPVLLAATLLSLVAERFNNVVLPEANYKAKSLMADIVKSKPVFGLTENAFSTLIDGYSILVRQTDPETGAIRGIVIYDFTRPDFRTIVTAESGDVNFSSDYHYLIITLENGEIHEIQQPLHKEYRKMSFKKHRFVFESSGFGFTRSVESAIRSDDRDLSSGGLLSISRDFRSRIALSKQRISEPLVHLGSVFSSVRGVSSPGDRAVEPGITKEGRTFAAGYVDKLILSLDQEIHRMESDTGMYNKYMAEYHKKYALAFACIVFALIGAPLGVLARRGGFGIGAGLSLVFFVLYWILMISGEKLAERGILDPGLSMWLGNITIGFIGLFLLYRLTGAVFNSSK
ncbi:MAG: YjgP/YjgQ family permease [Chlorobiaceae bacterium]|nr:YjgP/YjgQ family permease [Chlorobiaceae bacterium]NTW63369.1 YjgP/YjgQ family permease [Chlorobiaceae bacterium]